MAPLRAGGAVALARCTDELADLRGLLVESLAAQDATLQETLATLQREFLEG